MTIRDAHRGLTRSRIVESAVELMRGRGGDVTMTAVAEAAGVTERTVFRHFATREKLLEAVWQWCNERLLQAGLPQDLPGLLASPRTKFPRFDSHEALFRWFVSSPQGQAVRLSVKGSRQSSYLAVVRRARPDLGRGAQRRLAAICQLLDSSACWQSLHDYWDMDGSESGRAASEAIAVLLGGPSGTGS
jgi:AcrR family transcriptional regulator